MKSFKKCFMVLAFFPVCFAFGQSNNSQPPGEEYIPSPDKPTVITNGPNTQPPGEIYIPSPDAPRIIRTGSKDQPEGDVSGVVSDDEDVIEIIAGQDEDAVRRDAINRVSTETPIPVAKVGNGNPIPPSNVPKVDLDELHKSDRTSVGNANGNPKTVASPIPLDQQHIGTKTDKRVNQGNKD